MEVPAHVVDLSNQDASRDIVGTIVAKEARLDVLALAAGGIAGLAGLALEEIDDANWDRIMSANVKSTLWMAQAAAPIMTRANWGRIVVVSSSAGVRPSLTGLHAYTAAKHAVVNGVPKCLRKFRRGVWEGQRT